MTEFVDVCACPLLYDRSDLKGEMELVKAAWECLANVNCRGSKRSLNIWGHTLVFCLYRR